MKESSKYKKVYWSCWHVEKCWKSKPSQMNGKQVYIIGGQNIKILSKWWSNWWSIQYIKIPNLYKSMLYRQKKSPRRGCRGLRKTYHVTELLLNNEPQVNWSRFIIVNIKMMTKSMISRNSHICLQFPVYNRIYSSVIITEISRFT